MKSKIILFIIIIAIISLPVQAKEKSIPAYLDQQMILMGLYLYGINQELTKTVPDTDELIFLADSISEIATQAQKSKKGTLFHKNMSELLVESQKLSEISKTHDLSKVREQGHALINSCAKCHKMGSF